MNKSLTSLSLYLSANRMKAIELNNLLTDMTSDTHSKPAPDHTTVWDDSETIDIHIYEDEFMTVSANDPERIQLAYDLRDERLCQ